MPHALFLNKSEEIIEKCELKGDFRLFDLFDDEINYKLPAGCLAGSCGACRLEILAGSESLEPPTEKELGTMESILEHHNSLKETYQKETWQTKYRLSCRAKIVATPTVDLKFKVLI